MHVWNVRQVPRWKHWTQKIAILAPSHSFVGLCLCSWGMHRQSGKKLLNTDTSSTCPHNMVNFGILTAEICWRVLGTPANFNGFCVLAVLLHGTLVVGVNQTLWHWTEGATYIWQGSHHVGHRPTFVFLVFALQWHNMTLIRVKFGRVGLSEPWICKIVLWSVEECGLVAPGTIKIRTL